MQPLYQVESPASKALMGMNAAASTYASMDKKRKRPGPTPGGAIMSGGGGALAGATMAKTFGVASAALGPWAAVGGVVGLASYFFS